jgi:hypothetical protein
MAIDVVKLGQKIGIITGPPESSGNVASAARGKPTSLQTRETSSSGAALRGFRAIEQYTQKTPAAQAASAASKMTAAKTITPSMGGFSALDNYPKPAGAQPVSSLPSGPIMRGFRAVEQMPATSRFNLSEAQAKADLAYNPFIEQAQNRVSKSKAALGTARENEFLHGVLALNPDIPHTENKAATSDREQAAYDEARNLLYAMRTNKNVFVYEQVANSSDHYAYSKAGEAMAGGLKPGGSFEDAYKLYLEKTTEALDKAQGVTEAEVTRLEAAADAARSLMYASLFTENERSIYNDLLARFGKDKAEEYRASIQRRLDQRMSEKISLIEYETAKSNKLAGYAMAAPTAWTTPLAHFEVAYQNIKNAVTGEYEPVNAYSRFQRGVNTAEAIQEALTEDKGWFGKLLARTGFSMIQYVSFLPLGKQVALIALSSNAAGAAANSALKRGASPEQALAVGTIRGAIEYLTEKLPLENLFNLASQGVKFLSFATVKNALKQGGIETIEEIISEYLGTLSDIAIMGEKSDYAQHKQQLVSQGMSEAEARKGADRQFFVINPLLAGLGGLMSGIFMGSGASAVGYAQTYDVRMALKDAGLTDAQIDKAIASGALGGLLGAGRTAPAIADYSSWLKGWNDELRPYIPNNTNNLAYGKELEYNGDADADNGIRASDLTSANVKPADSTTQSIISEEGTRSTLTSKDIRFTQDSISATFKDGSSVDDLINGLKSGKISPNDVPAIRIFEKDGVIYSLDNRRLYAFKEAGIDNINYVWATPEEIANEAWKMTTNNGGVTIRVRGR